MDFMPKQIFASPYFCFKIPHPVTALSHTIFRTTCYTFHNQAMLSFSLKY